MARVVVVGAGMGGLAVAARLARLRHDVTLLEQAPVVGGKLGTYSRDGFTFDTGPSLLTLPAVYRDLFRKTGRPLEDVLELTPVDPVARYRFPDGTWVDVPNASRRAVAATFGEAFGGSAGEDWSRFLDRAGRIWQATRGPFLESPLDGPRDLLRQSRRDRRPAHDRTVGDAALGWVASTCATRGLRMFLDRYATYTGSDPRRAPAALAVVPYVEQTFGAWYVPGGLRRLGDALLARCQDRGVRVCTGAERRRGDAVRWPRRRGGARRRLSDRRRRRRVRRRTRRISIATW